MTVRQRALYRVQEDHKQELRFLWVSSPCRYTSKSLLLEKIDNLPYTGGNTNTIAALDSLSYVFNKENGDRPDVRKTAIIITDGKPRRGSDPIPIDEIRTAVRRVTFDWDIQLLVVGVTDNIDMDTLKELSSYPHTVCIQCKFKKNYTIPCNE